MGQRWGRQDRSGWGMGLAIALMLGVVRGGSVGASPATVTVAQTDWLQQGKVAYQTGNIQGAIQLWRQAQTQPDRLVQIQAQNYLGLAYGELGEWQTAQRVLQQSQRALVQLDSPQQPDLLAQNLNHQARLAFLQGQTETALDLWQQATQQYEATGNLQGVVGSKMNQAQAFQTLGQYRRAKDVLLSLVDQLDQSPDSPLMVQGLRSLGSAFFVIGDLAQAKVLLEASWQMGDRLQLPEETALALIEIGNIAQSSQSFTVANDYYEQALRLSDNAYTQLQARLQQLRLQVNSDHAADIPSLIQDITQRLEPLPGDRRSINGAIHFSASLLQTSTLPMPAPQLETFLNHYRQTAQTLQDQRSEAFVLQQLGQLYAQQQQWSAAAPVTAQSLAIATSLHADDLIAQGAWQLGRIYHAQQRTTEAIAAYQQAVQALQSLRSDLVAVNTDVQFNFRDRVEPVYRELVALLLEAPNPSQTHLRQARQVIENLQLAELDNFFRDACLDTKPVNIDQIDTHAAVIYPILLGDRLDVIVSLPDQTLRHSRHDLGAASIDRTLKNFYSSLYLGYSTSERLQLSQTLYRWLIEPFRATLDEQQIQTLVFVPDGFLRNLPMAALHDGDRYLIESYSLALSPGLQLFPQGLQPQNLSSLTVGLTAARQGFNALPGVATEVAAIAEKVESQVLLDESFTKQNFQRAINNRAYPVVHLATHGQFSSDPAETFLLTWDDRIGMADLDQFFEKRRLGQLNPIELLVLSACQTASGDDRATLGLAGLALRSGALSTLASLWSVNDQSTALLMTQFYQVLGDRPRSKAEALRQAQLALLRNPEYQHPYYWAAFVLVGNWL